ncbi:hypothetical protein [Flavobacterium sp.]|uniref:hypothetical protein n=1 Tax=Flavobacterium sp. TaxID=239 RepID=UPI0037C0623D
MENIGLLIGILTLLSTLILGVLNYKLTSESKKLKKIKDSQLSYFKALLGFIELEEKYISAYSELKKKKELSVKVYFRKDLMNPINSQIINKKKILEKINQLE